MTIDFRLGRRVLVSLVLVLVLLGAAPARANMGMRLPEYTLIGGLALGASTKSYDQFTAFEAIDRIRRSGAHVVEIHFGQVLSPGDTEVVVNDGLTEEQTGSLKRKASAAGAKLVAARVRFSNNQSANTRLFEWADALEVQMLVGDPPTAQFDNLEKLIRKYNIGIGILTAPKVGTTGSDWTNPKSLLTALRGRDPRFGVVANVLNLLRAGHDPFAAMTELRTRLTGVQLTDVTSLDRQARPVPFGQGVLDFRRFLTQLDSERFDGYVVMDWPAESAEFKDNLSRTLDFVRTTMGEVRRMNLLRSASREVGAPGGLRYEVLGLGEVLEPVRVLPAPDGSIWCVSRRGFVSRWDEAAQTNRVVGRLNVNTSGHRGLFGLAFDPGFLTNGYFYAYRTPMLSSGFTNRVSRFTAVTNATGWRIVADSERVLLDIPSVHHGLTQGGGFLLHPTDGCLYVGTGDNNLPEETARFYDDPATAAQNLGELRGKILRIRTDGSVPADNPFADTKAARPEIFAFGLRNPYTLSVDAGSGLVYAGDVGFDRRRDWEEINQVRPGMNYGWPRCEGRNRDTLSEVPCPLGDAVGPWFGYPHESASAVLVGPFVNQGPPPGWPSGFRHGLFYGDFTRRMIRFAQVDSVRNVVTNTILVATGLGGGPLGMALTPTGDLFLAEYAGWLAGSTEDRLSRIGPPRTPPAASAVAVAAPAALPAGSPGASSPASTRAEEKSAPPAAVGKGP